MIKEYKNIPIPYKPAEIGLIETMFAKIDECKDQKTI